ncbi:acetyl-CoA carboxylase biotin carboxyl carrier protein [Lederbergia wuyishanensis]|uniref:Biotin carboxyl carrier protein of acetyl-CoA carboxylase n=1 Tax=Lederbergia wuyishanensis TaxID=1347903 RepID=A0ABU0D1B9_9BACI|nr:acetyl-CoA carboxylase biotin carboxyl carrier protein [Lederbergia wuyishanensis]MCJ8006792.1 acetyl-CoA carboxylase biotin carboxyl carrier protein [Lederbergia wuyishanensis]MDQ0342174.1 acetyl-CoA carboxylase biotin carboxyl carrier protein [Lederbergia wuyishanensis]
MLKIQEIREIIKLIDESDIEEFSFEHEGSKIKLKKQTASVPVAQPQQQIVQQPVAVQPPVQAVVETPAPTQKVEAKIEGTTNKENYLQVVSPMVGTFYESPSPDSPAYVEIGSQVKADTVVCIVEAMKLFNEIEAEVDGEIVEVLVKNGELVEYGQPLFLVKPR